MKLCPKYVDILKKIKRKVYKSKQAVIKEYIDKNP